MPSPPPAFGRRRLPQVAPAVSPPLSDPAERFRAELAASAPADDAFAAWRRKQAAGRGAAWLATFALLTPGVLCFVLRAPDAVSLAVETTGVVGNWWLRRERRRHLKAIADWRLEDGPAAS